MLSRASLAVAVFCAYPIRPAVAQSEGEFANTIQGISLRPEIGTGIYGYELMGNLGGTSFATRALQSGSYLLQWNADAEVVGGAVAYEHPFYALYGVQVQGQGDGGWRLMPANFISPYLGVGLVGHAMAVAQSGQPLDGTHFNNLGDLGGLLGTLQLRISAGGSLLNALHSLVLAAHFLMELDSPQSTVPGLVFVGGGLHARYDFTGGLVAFGEISYAVSVPQHDTALDYSTQTNRWVLSASGVKTLGSHVFVGLGISVSREQVDISYTGGLTYDPDSSVDSRIWIIAGYSP
jgi:hypothetical protein